MARAPTLLGPWEKRRRPVLRGGGGIRCPGHAGVTSGRDGKPLLAYHAYAPGDPANRRLFTAPVRFDVAGWPVVGAARRMRGIPEGIGWEWPAGRRPRLARSGERLVLGRGTVARQTGTVRFDARVVVDAADRGARPSLAVTGSEGNAVGIELRVARAVAWRSVEGRAACWEACGSSPAGPWPARGGSCSA